MNDNVFGRVKDAVARDPARILLGLGVTHKKGNPSFGQNWTSGFICPLCDDKSGSASFSRELFLKCHQCQAKLDLFNWLAQTDTKSAWEHCKELAEKLHVDTSYRPHRRRGMPVRMTKEVLNTAIHELWESDQAEPVRRFLRERKLDDPVVLAELGIGFIRGYLVFAQFDARGNLLDRYRGYLPGGQVKWQWFGKGTGGPGIWPARHYPKADVVLLLEGEWDVLTGLIRLRLLDANIVPVTWTAGAGSCPHPRNIPAWMPGKEIWIAYDNDVWQGIDYANYVVVAKGGQKIDRARTGMEQRRENLIERLAPLFDGLNCKVSLLRCPISAKELYGADLRDWVDKGGRNLDEWERTAFEDVPPVKKPPMFVPFSESFRHLHKSIMTRTQVSSIVRDDVVIPLVALLECSMGQHPICATCNAAARWPDRLVPFQEFPRELALAMNARYPDDYLIRNVIQPPRACPRVEIVPLETAIGSKWFGLMPSEDTEDQKHQSMAIISREPPSLSGEVEVTGTVYPSTDASIAMMWADKVESLDQAEIDLKPYVADFTSVCPPKSDPELIDEYLDNRWRDFACHVTKIHGRRDIQVSHDLLAHSAIEMQYRGSTQRGWLDICVFGDTRSGKSLTFRRMLQFHGLGLEHTAVSNISRAGLVMGTDRGGLIKPGLFPKSHRKMLMLDEWHFIVENNRGGDHPMSWLQSARDMGYASGVKISGDRKLPARVRFVTIANWTRNSRRTFEFAAQHLLPLYGSPESLARLDFGLSVAGPPSQEDLDDVDQFWTADRTRALILRAWAQTAEHVKITPEALQLTAERIVSWRDFYEAQELPLFTAEEKTASLLRVAIAVANVCFSHPSDNVYAVKVEEGHVEWAAEWMKRLWKESGYERYSASVKTRETIDKPFTAEQVLTVKSGLDDPAIAEIILSQFVAPFGVNDVGAALGKDVYEATKWVAQLQSAKVVKRRRALNGYNVEFLPTIDGHRMIQNLLALCQNDPESYVKRQARLQNWYQEQGEPSGLKHMNREEWEVLDDSVPF